MKKQVRELLAAWPGGGRGVVVGLFLARLALEVARRPWPAALVVGVALLAALAGLVLARRTGAAAGNGSWMILLVYVAWPRRDLLAAAAVATLAALTWFLGSRPVRFRRWVEPLADGLTLIAALALYAATAADDILPADAGEFQLTAALLGVAHPPGYPLYTLVGHLFIRLLPWGIPAGRLNVMSALLAAITLPLVARATRLWARRLGASPWLATGCGLAGAFALGTATTFWAQATIANVRTPAVFLAALALFGLSRFAAAADQRQADRALLILGIALGLGGGHYPPLAFVSLFFAAYVLLTDPHLLRQPRRWWKPLLAGLLCFLAPLAYLPIRGAAGAPLAPEGLDTLSGLLHHILARGFAGDMFAFANAADLPHRLALMPTLFSFQFNVTLLGLALLGLLGLLWRDWRLFVMLAGSLILHTFVTITYRAPQTVEYLMPAYLPIAISIGVLPAILEGSAFRSNPRVTAWLSSFLAAAALLAGLLNGFAHGPSFFELAGDTSTHQAVAPLLETAPAGSLILADWHWATPLWVLQEVEGIRPDVEVQYVWPVAGEEYRDMWLQRVQEAHPTRAVLMTHFYDFPGYTVEPWETGFRIQRRPVTEPSALLTPAPTLFGERVELLGYRLLQGRLQPGGTQELVLAWRPAGTLDDQPSFTLRLLDEEGQPVAQADQSLGSDAAPGEVCFERLVLPLLPTLRPGRYVVTLGAYTVTESGFETLPSTGGEEAVMLADLLLAAPSRPRFTLHPQALPFDDGPTLTGVDYDRSLPGVLRVTLNWQGPVDEGTQVLVRTGAGGESTVSLAALPEGAYQTVAVDLPDYSGGPLELVLTDGQGQVSRAAGPWGCSLQRVTLPAAAADARFVPLGDEMAVIGVEAHPAGAGETMIVDVRWVALRPLTRDDAISVRLLDADGRWLARHDMQPALGAVPTLKWIQGSRVVDRHLLSLPQDLQGSEVQASLVAYERFRLTPLPSTDGRFAETPLGSWTLP